MINEGDNVTLEIDDVDEKHKTHTEKITGNSSRVIKYALAKKNRLRNSILQARVQKNKEWPKIARKVPSEAK